MRVLVGCERYGGVRNAFLRRGHQAYSCDTHPSVVGGPHFQMDIKFLLRPESKHRWDLLIVHPPCTHLCVSGLHWNRDNPRRQQRTEDDLDFVVWLLNLPIPRIALENPIGCIGTRIRKHDQLIQPYNFGDDAKKSTCLWLKGLPHLKPTGYVEPRMVNGKPRWGNQTDSGHDRGGGNNQSMKRARTFPGIAEAMADQWGSLEEIE
jgi:hypothetical protein